MHARIAEGADLEGLEAIDGGRLNIGALLEDRKGAVDERMEDFRWLLEELRVSFFAQELRTPQPVSIKRLEKVWSQLNG